MEHSRLVSLSLKCNKCTRAWSVSEEDFKNVTVTCGDPECQSQFSVYEGLRNGLKMEENISPNTFLANEMFHDIVDLKIGYFKDIELPSNIRKIFKINIFPFGAFHAGAVDITNNGFRLMTSVSDESSCDLFGEDVKAMVMVHAKTEDYTIPWLHMLSYALQQYRDGEYVTSILLSEIAFESYIDTTLSEGYRKIGLDEDSISRFLRSANIPDKVNALMKNVYDVKLKDNRVLNKIWEDNVLQIRNHIAHGRKSTATKEEAKIAYDTVVDSIFHFIEAIDRKERKI